MFKKAVEAKSVQRLSGADRKKLRRAAKERFSGASDEDMDLILPPKADITVSKYPNRALVYGVDPGGIPMLFDLDGRGSDILPTVYALWKVPHLLPAFLLKGVEVSRYVIGGADLMFPGIAIPDDHQPLPTFQAGEPWAVKVPANPMPIAVGTTNLSSSEAFRAGFRGKALRIAHYYPDFLWQVQLIDTLLLASADGCYVPNAGFLEDVVLQDPASLFPDAQTSNSSANVDGASTDQQNGVGGGDAEDAALDASMRIATKDDVADEAIPDVKGLKVTGDSITQAPNGEKDQHVLSIEQVDSLLDKCLLQALHSTVKDIELPVPGSTLWTAIRPAMLYGSECWAVKQQQLHKVNVAEMRMLRSSHVLPCRPSGITLDIKKSSHKKLSKWLQSKSSIGLISVKEDKHTKEVVLQAVNRGHAEYISFRPEKRPVEMVDHGSAPKENEGHPQKAQLEITEIYKPSVHVNPIFASVGADTKHLFTASESSDIVFKYVDSQNLVKPTDKAYVVLDAVLCDALYKGTVKKGSTYPSEIHKKDLGAVFVSRMQPHHKVTSRLDSVVRKGAIKAVQIMTERRQGNKKMTRVSGLESFLVDAEALASDLQKKFACSTTVAELPGKKGHEVMVQGGVIGDLAKHLVENLGIPKRYIEVRCFNLRVENRGSRRRSMMIERGRGRGRGRRDGASWKRFRGLVVVLALLAVAPPIFFHFRLKRFQQTRAKRCSWLNNPPPLVCAHGGHSSTNAFPNTMSAFRMALTSGVDCIEIDVSRSSDGGFPAISGNNTARVAYFTFKDIQGMKATHLIQEQFHDLQIPTVEDALKLVSKSVRRVILDAKVGPPSHGKGLAKDILSVIFYDAIVGTVNLGLHIVVSIDISSHAWHPYLQNSPGLKQFAKI
ncbi:hypothetical protein Syun_013474 [Stephania yunnanensis]|uniref:glycerophosphodiester phosphodiesterase n=1 Tax=Stephania yunnanensis TaxID=152371 RepID=A0AAP0JHM7_9MAGN